MGASAHSFLTDTGIFIMAARKTRPPLPKQNYGNDMAKTGPYLSHIWVRYGKVGGMIWN